MGKYMRKAKISGEVAVMELAQSSLGVRTRARTLALQRLQKTPMSPTSNSGTSYLQLRSRRLEKTPLPVQSSSNDLNKQEEEEKSCKGISNPSPNPNPSSCPRIKSRLAAVGSVNSASVGSVSKMEDGVFWKDKEEDAAAMDNFNDLGCEASFGENVLEIEPRERTTRETTPCSLIRGSDTVGTPGSTTRPTNSSATNRRIQNTVRRNIPTAHEMEEFFAGAEQQQQRIFTEKYNFDPLTETPLTGRYEWERVNL